MKKYTKEELYKMDVIDVYKLVLKEELKKFPNGFWQQPEAKQNAAKCTRYLIEEILNYDDKELKDKNSTNMLLKINYAVCYVYVLILVHMKL